MWKRYTSLKRVAGGTAGITSVVVGVYIYYRKRYVNDSVIQASKTANYAPSSAKWDSNWDKCDPKSLKPSSKSEKEPSALSQYENKLNEPSATATRYLLLLRHGQFNLDGKVDEERVLTKLGRLQAEKAGQRLQELNFPYLHIISSTMARAKGTTAEIHKVMPHLDVVYDDCLREGMPIQPDPPLKTWKPEQKFFQDGARIEYAFRKFFHRAPPTQKEDSCEIIVCHANVIRYFVCRALQIPAEAWLRFCLHHASITLIRILPNGNVTLVMMGDCGSMAPHELTQS